MTLKKRLGRRRPQADLLEGELSKQWVLAQINHCLEKRDEDHSKQINELQRRLDVTKQTLAVAITEILTTKQVVRDAAAMRDALPTSLVFQMVCDGMGIFDGSDALKEYILRFNGGAVDQAVDTSTASTPRTPEQVQLDEANARMASAYLRAVEIEMRRDQLLERVALRIATNAATEDPLEQILIEASRYQT